MSASNRAVASRYSCTQRSITVAVFSTLVNCPTTCPTGLNAGLPNQTDAMFTVIEGDTWAEVMAVVQRAVEAVAARAPRVSAVIKVDWRPGVTDAMTQKVATVERYLLRPE